jgi:hypothetical protein
MENLKRNKTTAHIRVKVKLFHYMPWRHMGGEEV